MALSIDFETRSATNLLTDGAYNYASCPSTDVICMAYSVDGGAVDLWTPGDGVPEVFRNPGYWYAWNATFERLIYEYVMVNDYDFPSVPLETWRCTAFMSRCNNLPNALGNAARCLKVDQQKSSRGKELIKLLCIPLADGTFCEDPKLLEEMYGYCRQDVRTEMAVYAQLRQPNDDEWHDYFANERINDRGIRIDSALCEAARGYAAEEEADLIARIEEVTEGVVTKARGEKLKEWAVERLTEDQQALLVKHRGGEKMLSLDKYNRGRLLALDDLDPDVQEVVECSDFAQKSSVGKFKALQRLADPDDGRVRGALMCNGASQSGRYSSKGAQVHNFPRMVMGDPEEVRADLIDEIMPEDIVEHNGLPIMTILSRMLRPALVPAPGNVFLVSDWSAIEGRVAPWLCDTAEGEEKLSLYRDKKPVYEITAAATFNCKVEEVTKDQRQVGKVQELSMQYQGGANAFMAMARGYGLNTTKAEAEKYKKAWRRNNPWAEHIWADIERAARLAVTNPGHQYRAGKLMYVGVRDILAGGITLFCKLPCGRYLTYPDVRIEMKEAPWGDPMPQLTMLRAAFVPKANEKEWPRSGIYGGLLFENAVQGTAASLLREAVYECYAQDLNVVFHVHDELVLEHKPGNGVKVLHQIMNTAPEWADGLPLAADVEVMERFGK